jgi:hypothetical protein
MDNTRIPKKELNKKISWKNKRGKTKAEVGTQNQEEIIVVVKYKRKEETRRS